MSESARRAGRRPLVVLLRAVNVAGHHRVAMADVRAALDEDGLPGVTTHLQTGNLLVPTAQGPAALATRVERVLAEALGIDTVAIVRTGPQLHRALRAHPFADAGDAATVAFGFCRSSPTRAAVASLRMRDFGADEWAIRGADLFLHYPAGQGRAKLTGAVLEKALDVRLTVRNRNVTSALTQLASGATGAGRG